jgi:KUP system potassium uptake protein
MNLHPDPGRMASKPALDPRAHLRLLTLGALGVVFGDIGTSPLYAIKECFGGPHAVAVTSGNVLGVVSLILWSLIIVVSIEYLSYVTRADNHGEGGILALLALALPSHGHERKGSARWLLFLGLFGASVLYGDGVITPAISVLSAVEGVKVYTPALEAYIVPATLAILCGLFLLQKRGSGGIGRIFGPVMLVWFVCIALLGIGGICRNFEVLRAFSPLYALRFFLENGRHGFVVLGAVFLAITGAEALYADLGHFGRPAIKRGWFLVALPALTLNYLGQAALLLTDPTAAENPFYRLAPQWLLVPAILMATAATVIASQAVITGSFSLTLQAVQLGYLPRLEIRHTSAEEIGQIYVPVVNWILFAATILLVLLFRTSSNLAAAYGIAVSLTMVITPILMYSVAVRNWHWNGAAVGLLTAFFLAVELSFFGANASKILQGGWFPLLFGLVVFTLMTTWHRGRRLLAGRLEEVTTPFPSFLREVPVNVKTRVPGTAVFMVRNIEQTPAALLHNLRHNHILHERVLLLKVLTGKVPYVPEDRRLELIELVAGFYGLVVHFGFKEYPDVPRALAQLPDLRFPYDPKEVTYFLGRENVISTPRPGMARWRERLFGFLARNAQSATAFFNLPAGQVVELGLQIEI